MKVYTDKLMDSLWSNKEWFITSYHTPLLKECFQHLVADNTCRDNNDLILKDISVLHFKSSLGKIIKVHIVPYLRLKDYYIEKHWSHRSIVDVELGFKIYDKGCRTKEDREKFNNLYNRWAEKIMLKLVVPNLVGDEND